ncbi:MAG: LVIVD repeat-containing protein [Carbonactinosporaceae bacterium]
MKRGLLVLAFFLLIGLGIAVPAGGDVADRPGGGSPGTAENFQEVGHNPLFGRGMNAAHAVFGDHVYVGNRTDGSSRCGVGDPGSGDPDSCPHEHPGILAVDIEDPSDPTVVGEFGNEFVTGANAGQTAREMRVWPEQKLLMVMYFRCSSVIHACPPSSDTFSIRFFDLAADPADPPLVASYQPTRKPHEMYLWTDPKDADRALLWISAPTTSADPNRANLVITDISRAREGVFREVAKGNWNQFYPGSETPANYDNDLALHSMAPTPDGRRTYLAYLRGHFLVLDTSDVADGVAPGEVVDLNDKLVTQPADRPQWGTSDGGCLDACAESHSAVPVPGRPFALTTDEVYGTFTAPSHGCPWGWSRMISTARQDTPRITSEYKIAQNDRSFCGIEGDPADEQFTSYASHNPTLTRHLALITWHSGGLQAIDTSNPRHLSQAGWFSPTPLDTVTTEDPALSRGTNKVVMWSYPIVRDGLVYVIDIRNGLYVLRYDGNLSREVKELEFLEGNSNLGDAVRIHGRH